MDTADLQAIWITLKLATLTTIVLIVVATPIAWWLATSASRFRGVVAAAVSLPLVLPPTVLGFYLLVWMGPHGLVGKLSRMFDTGLAPFTFHSLVIASVIFSFPFAVQPIRSAFETIGKRPLEVAATLRAGPIDRFFSIALPLARPGFLSAAILVFAHTIGEFGVVLMIGGNIPGETRVVSIAIYNHVEALEYPVAHLLSAGMVLVSFLFLFLFNLVGSVSKEHDG